MIDPTARVWTYGCCAAIGAGSCSSCSGGGAGGSFCELTDPNGNRIVQNFDNMGRVVSVTDSLSNTTFTEYDKAGRKNLETDANGNATRYGYDEAGRLLFVLEANNARTEYTYDKNGNKLTQKDANGHIWHFRYDAMNRLIEEKDPKDRITTYTYDSLGNLKTKTDAKNQTATYHYNVRRLTSVAYTSGTTTLMTENFGYDSLGRRTSAANGVVTYTYDYDSLNRLIAVTNQTRGLTASYEYDAAGNRTKMTLPRQTGQTFVSRYIYDAKNRLVTIDDAAFGQFRFTYDAMDRRTALQYPNGTSTAYTYDKAYRLTAIATRNSGGTILDAWSYSYDGVGNRLSKTNLSGQTELYAYDDVYRLTEVTYGDGTFERFTYDRVGNRETLTDGTGTVTYRYDVANQLETAGSTTFTYDGNGNTETKTVTGATTTFTYDVKNRLTGISSGETSQYNADGLRVSYSNNPVASGTYAVQYDLAGNPVLDWNSGNAFQDYRVYGPGIDEVLAELHTGGTRKTFLHHDALGSVTAVSDASGLVAYRASYRAFGQMTRPTTSQLGYHPTRLGYTGREISTGTLMNYRSRHYDTATGRFLQEDVYRGNDIIPPSLHQYAYVHNNPVRYNDPTGHLPWPQMIAASLIAYIAFVVVGALLATALKLVDVCGRDNDCVSSFLESAFGHIQLVPIIGFFYLIIDIFTSGVINNPLEGVLWLFLSGLFALVVMEELITPWVAATFKTPLGRGAATIGALFAAQYIWSKFSWWFLSYNQRLVQQGTQQQQRGSQ